MRSWIVDIIGCWRLKCLVIVINDQVVEIAKVLMQVPRRRPSGNMLEVLASTQQTGVTLFTTTQLHKENISWLCVLQQEIYCVVLFNGKMQ